MADPAVINRIKWDIEEVQRAAENAYMRLQTLMDGIDAAAHDGKTVPMDVIRSAISNARSELHPILRQHGA